MATSVPVAKTIASTSLSSSGRISIGTLIAFGLPAMGSSFYLMFVGFYFLMFATDVLLIAPAVVGAIFGFGRIWDAISDPLIGSLSDRTRSRLGRRRPWMLVGIPLLAISFAMLWRPPAGLAGPDLIVWCAASMFLFYSAQTIYSVPHLALGAELSEDHHERSRIFGTQRAGFILGMLLSFAAIHFATNTESPREDTGVIALIIVAVVSLCLLAAPIFLRERVAYSDRPSAPPLAAMRNVLANPHARILLVVWFVESLGGGVLGVLAPYMTKYVIGRPDLIVVVPAFFIVPGIAAIPVWIALSRRFGKRDVWIAAMIGSGVFFGATGFLEGEEDIVALCALMTGAGACFACGGTLGQSILADIIDHDELHTGHRKEGAYTAAYGFALKLGLGTTVILTGFALGWMGFVPDVEQSDTTKFGLRMLFAGTPLAGYWAGAFIFRRFSLTGAEHARIRAELDSRASAAASETPK